MKEKIRTHDDKVIELLTKAVINDEYNDLEQANVKYGGKVSEYEELKMLFNIYGKKGRVLDIGCGSGILFKLLPISYGIEPNPNRVRLVKGNKVKLGFIEAIPFPSNYFTTAIAWGVMCFVRSESEALVEVNRVLERGGRFIFDVVEETNLLIAKVVNPKCFARWCENFGFTSLAVMPLKSPQYHRRWSIVLEKERDFNWKYLTLPQVIGGKIKNYTEERYWWLR